MGASFWAGPESGEEALVFNRKVGDQEMTGKWRTSIGRGPENWGKLSKTDEQKKGHLASWHTFVALYLVFSYTYFASMLNL